MLRVTQDLGFIHSAGDLSRGPAVSACVEISMYGKNKSNLAADCQRTYSQVSFKILSEYIFA